MVTSRIFTEVEHKHIVKFLRPHLNLRYKYGIIYWLLNIIPIFALTFFSISKHVSLDMLASKLGLGFVAFLFLIPLHEGIHAAAYRMVGATKVTLGGSLQKFVFYALADKFEVNYNKFKIVAFAPFVVINIALITLITFLPTSASLIVWGAFILHNAGCFGDFALVSFLHQRRHLGITTMDSVSEGKTFFFVNI